MLVRPESGAVDRDRRAARGGSRGHGECRAAGDDRCGSRQTCCCEDEYDGEDGREARAALGGDAGAFGQRLVAVSRATPNIGHAGTSRGMAERARGEESAEVGDAAQIGAVGRRMAAPEVAGCLGTAGLLESLGPP